ncbi:Fis family transcriptional regulator [Paenibacillus frigoriresistens]|uniref:AP2 domain-containing protein n=1 Tax=Paenibacillus alginolyticus TaxID=59839 RepID=UPI001566E373|nr:Fis family transcriptional regulator [Paenibacillus frigoriresistens]
MDQSVEIDHKNHDTLDNRRSVNLRFSDRSENMQNRKGAPSHSKSGIRGVCFANDRRKWRAQLQVKGRKIHLGSFDDVNEAEKAVLIARAKYMTHSSESRDLNGS